MVPLSSQHWHKMSLLGAGMCFLSCLRTLGCVFTLLCWLFFCLSPPVFESSTGLENALKNCSCTCFSILALRQENVDGGILGTNSPGNRRRSPARQQWEQLSCRDGKTHGSAKLENGGQNIISLCFPFPTVCCSFPWISASSYSWQHSGSVGGTRGAAAAELSLLNWRIWQYREEK